MRIGAGKWAFVAVVLVASFFVHRFCQEAYFTYCTSNIFIVLFFKNSNFCRILEDTIAIVEMNYKKLLL